MYTDVRLVAISHYFPQPVPAGEKQLDEAIPRTPCLNCRRVLSKQVS
jgi:hypothetical protein